jgi:superfamily II DNA or RNA helicase
MGFDDEGWSLPKLIEIRNELQSNPLDGELFAMPVRGLPMEREERKATISIRCDKAAELLTQHENGVAWCHFNAEADYLARSLPGGVNLSGSDKDEVKEEKFAAFKSGEIKYLVTKPKIAALGVNWQHSNACTYFDDYSYEQYYQAVRRMWRFWQKKDVTVYQIGTTSLSNVAKSRKRKAEAADNMFASMMEHMVNAQGRKEIFTETQAVNLPSWI